MSTSKSLNKEMRSVSTVSYKTQSFAPNLNSSFAWQGPIQLHEAEVSSLRVGGMHVIERTIAKELARKQYRVYSNMPKADYYLHAAVLMGNNTDLQNTLLNLGLAPQVGEANVKYDRGTLVLFITRGLHTIQWRGAGQIFTDPSMDISVAENRVSAAITTLLSSLPKLQ